MTANEIAKIMVLGRKRAEARGLDYDGAIAARRAAVAPAAAVKAQSSYRPRYCGCGYPGCQGDHE